MNSLFHPEMTPAQVNAMSALALAHIGDAVFELLVRTKLCVSGGTTNGRLHHDTIARVCAPAQAVVAERLFPLLTEEETAFYRRGKNSHTHAIPKNATHAQYARATGLETLFGALWLLGRQERVEALFADATEEDYAL